ncbi:molybdenum cofactor guanylyltransferase [Brevibacillus reuszeri]|uniref:molybdenum cofactor guanylyltransferase n=1 Tax=Brevibacillus reuszeri TaxID=54915 RepID=UPI0028A0CA30|nr:molybdenum cofactor guanylyltransferase [Brevibacillus reuszeri]
MNSVAKEGGLRMQKMSAVILAGGNSSRMGTPKELLTWREGTFLTELVREVGRGGMDCLVISNYPERLPAEVKQQPGVRITTDLVPSAGPVSGIVTAFRVCQDEMLLVLSCDLPFMDHKQMEKLIAHALEQTEWDVVAAQVDGRLHPLCAVYHRSSQMYWEQALQNNELRLMATLDKLRLCKTPDGLLDSWAVFNANTPEEYELAQNEEKKRKTGER